MRVSVRLFPTDHVLFEGTLKPAMTLGALRKHVAGALDLPVAALDIVAFLPFIGRLKQSMYENVTISSIGPVIYAEYSRLRGQEAVAPSAHASRSLVTQSSSTVGKPSRRGLRRAALREAGARGGGEGTARPWEDGSSEAAELRRMQDASMVHRSRDRSGVKRSGHPFRLGAARALPERKRAKDDDNGDNDDAEEEEEEEEDLALAEEEAADDGSDQVVEDTLDDAAWPEKQERVGRDRSARAAKPKATGRTRRAVAAPARGATRSRSRSKATAPATAAIAASAASAAAVPTGRRSTIQQSSDEANEPKGRKGPPPAARRAASRASAAAAKRRGGRGARSLTTRKRSAPDADTPVRGRRASHRAKPPAPSSRDRPRVRSRGIPRSRDRAPSSSPPPKSDDEGGRGLPTSAGAGEHEAVSAGRSQAPPLGDDAPAWTAGVGTLRNLIARGLDSLKAATLGEAPARKKARARAARPTAGGVEDRGAGAKLRAPAGAAAEGAADGVSANAAPRGSAPGVAPQSVPPPSPPARPAAATRTSLLDTVAKAGGRGDGDAGDSVSFSAFVPPSVARGAEFAVDVWAYLREQREEMLAEALAVDPGLAEGGRKNSLRVARGSVVRVVLLPSDDPAAFRVEGGAAEDEIEWEGDVANATVSAVCLPTCPPGRHMLSVAVIREGGARPAKLRFAVRVGEQRLDAASPTPSAPIAPWSAGIRDAGRSPSITSVASDEQELVEIGPDDDDARFFDEVVRRARRVRAERRQPPLEVRVLRRIPWQDLRADDRPAIGCGCFGSVIKGEYRGVPVAVKQMRSDKVTEEAFVREAALAASAGGHPHVLGLIGVQARSPLYRIVMPYAPLGSVEGALVAPVRRLREPGSGVPAGWPFWGGHVPGEQRNAGPATLSAFPSGPLPDGCTAAALQGGHAADGAPALDWGGALLLLRQVASALEHLHAIGIVHGDVAARNVLLDSPSHALVGDFGLADVSARLVTEEARMAQRMRVMPLRYSSPELLLRGELTPASDVYAFGMLCFEVLVCEQPWAAVESSQEVAVKALSGLRPRFPPQFPRPAVALVLRCWQEDPASRPPICAIRQELDALATAAGVDRDGGGHDREGAEQQLSACYASYIAR